MNNQIEPNKRLGKEQWQILISEQQESAMTQSEFCRSKGLCLATFHNWKRKLSDNSKQANSQPPEFIELPVPSQPQHQQAWDIELELPGNVILRMRQ